MPISFASLDSELLVRFDFQRLPYCKETPHPNTGFPISVKSLLWYTYTNNTRKVMIKK